MSTTTISTSPFRRRTRRLGALAALGTALALVPVAPTEAATTSFIDVTVAETLAVTSGTVIADSGLGCSGGTVTTTSNPPVERGNVTRFSGTKQFDCGSGDTLSISFRVRARGCADRAFGGWRVIGGTGSFEDARGGGVLVGTYTGGNACTATGIDDRYRGVIRS